MPEKKVILVDKNSFLKKWVCNVARSGFHNGAVCQESDPHGDWGCGWRYELFMSYAEEDFLRIWGEQDA